MKDLTACPLKFLRAIMFGILMTGVCGLTLASTPDGRITPTPPDDRPDPLTTEQRELKKVALEASIVGKAYGLKHEVARGQYVELARQGGLKVPTVYNSGGYDSVDTVRQLDGLIDIYMPDMKYGDAAIAGKLNLLSVGGHLDLIDTFTMLGDPATNLERSYQIYMPITKN